MSQGPAVMNSFMETMPPFTSNQFQAFARFADVFRRDDPAPPSPDLPAAHRTPGAGRGGNLHRRHLRSASVTGSHEPPPSGDATGTNAQQQRPGALASPAAGPRARRSGSRYRLGNVARKLSGSPLRAIGSGWPTTLPNDMSSPHPGRSICPVSRRLPMRTLLLERVHPASARRRATKLPLSEDRAARRNARRPMQRKRTTGPAPVATDFAVSPATGALSARAGEASSVMLVTSVCATLGW